VAEVLGDSLTILKEDQLETFNCLNKFVYK